MNTSNKTLYALLVVAVVVSGIGIGFVIQHPNMAADPQAQQFSHVSVYKLNLVEVMDASYNGTAGAQPKYFVSDNGALGSSASITLPANTEIAFTITSYDMGNASVPAQFLRPIGLVGNSVNVVYGAIAMGDNTSQQWQASLTSFPASQVLHTFTIINNGNVLVNIPVIAGTTETGAFYVNTTGTFAWQCEASCGTGSSGWGGPMADPGWMSGTVDVV